MRQSDTQDISTRCFLSTVTTMLLYSSSTHCWKHGQLIIRWSSPGLYPIRPWNHPKMETVQLLWATYLDCSRGEEVFLYIMWTALLSVYASCVSSSHHTPLWRGWLCLLNSFHVDVLGDPEVTFFSGVNKPWSLKFFSQGKLSSPQLCWCPLQYSLLFSNVFTVWSGPKLDKVVL